MKNYVEIQMVGCSSESLPIYGRGRVIPARHVMKIRHKKISLKRAMRKIPLTTDRLDPSVE